MEFSMRRGRINHIAVFRNFSFVILAICAIIMLVSQTQIRAPGRGLRKARFQMVREKAAPAAKKRRPNAHFREVRRARIFARLREGWPYAEIACGEGRTSRRIRQIVSETGFGGVAIQDNIARPMFPHIAHASLRDDEFFRPFRS